MSEALLKMFGIKPETLAQATTAWQEVDARLRRIEELTERNAATLDRIEAANKAKDAKHG